MRRKPAASFELLVVQFRASWDERRGRGVAGDEGDPYAVTVQRLAMLSNMMVVVCCMLKLLRLGSNNVIEMSDVKGGLILSFESLMHSGETVVGVHVRTCSSRAVV